MSTRQAIIKILEEIAPPVLAESFDEGKIGLIIEGKDSADKIVTALDVTEKVVKSAIEYGADFLVVHHTPIWYPLTAITGQDAKLIRMVLGAGLNIYVMHTNYDHAVEGINYSLANILSLTERENMSLGIVGTVNLTIQKIAKKLNAPLRIWGEPTIPKRLAVVGGSGFDSILIDEALSLHADAFLSAELKHSIARKSPMLLLESTHYALEAPGMYALAEKMSWHYIDDVPLVSDI